MLIVFSGFVIMAGLFACVGLIGNDVNIKLAKSVGKVVKEDVLVPVLDSETGYWTFTADRDFKILQLTDIHLGGGFMSIQKDANAIKAVVDLVNYTKPDLIALTGDLVYPVPIQSGTFNNLISTKILIELMESLGIYWTVTFGNHDSEVYSYYSRKQIAECYANPDLEYCLFQMGENSVDGYGNYFINIKNSGGIITQSLVFLDSHAYVKGFFNDYDNIHQNQIDWYEAEINRLDTINRSHGATEMLSSIAFFHIPLVEYKDAWDAYVDNGMADTAYVKLIYGAAGERVCCGVGEDNLFETMQELKSTHAIFAGHDHYNNFSIEYTTEGHEDFPIRLTYGMSVDYLAYLGIDKETSQRGGTVITSKTDGSMDCHGLRLIDFAVID